MKKWLPETFASQESNNGKPSREIIEKATRTAKVSLKKTKPTLTDIAHAAQVMYKMQLEPHVQVFKRSGRVFALVLACLILCPGEEQEGVRYFLKLDNDECFHESFCLLSRFERSEVVLRVSSWDMLPPARFGTYTHRFQSGQEPQSNAAALKLALLLNSFKYLSAQ
uniref:Uncharacterized protein n=1 Tax=Micrurus corallinus TaxID=54390 RepID=A0A2D4G9L8_MICCO